MDQVDAAPADVESGENATSPRTRRRFPRTPASRREQKAPRAGGRSGTQAEHRGVLAGRPRLWPNAGPESTVSMSSIGSRRIHPTPR
jgi:hypothetical protein